MRRCKVGDVTIKVIHVAKVRTALTAYVEKVTQLIRSDNNTAEVLPLFGLKPTKDNEPLAAFVKVCILYV
jgi:hypothetical protein